VFANETHILVVDDSVNIRRMITDTLYKMGFSRVTSAGDANEAMTKLRAALAGDNPCALILSDLNMPGPSGLDFLKNVRSDEVLKSLPFILVTTESEKGAVLKAVSLGVSSYVVKPFNVDTLTKKMQEAFRKHYKTGSVE
jgi:two-component system chemotaxis response regulator CheY